MAHAKLGKSKEGADSLEYFQIQIQQCSAFVDNHEDELEATVLSRMQIWIVVVDRHAFVSSRDGKAHWSEKVSLDEINLDMSSATGEMTLTTHWSTVGPL